MKKIPKIIHYCWFGRKEKNELVKFCIESWRNFLPDYQIIEWNEDNFNININKYVKKAYEKKKYAFVSDYVRLWALYNYGGIYLDTDIEVVKKLDIFLQNDAFGGYETQKHIGTAILGSTKENKAIKLFLDDYLKRKFIKLDGTIDYTTNVERITTLAIKYLGFAPEKGKQVLKYGIQIYPKEYFCPKNYETGEIKILNNTYVIHHFNGSWKENEKERRIRKMRQRYIKLIKILFLILGVTLILKKYL